MERLIDGERRLRREYSAAFKASVLARTREPGASVAGVALSHGLHPNMVQLPLAPTVAPGPVASPVTPAPTQASPSQDLIRVEIQRAGATVTMQWPVSAAAQCAQMLRELLR